MKRILSIQSHVAYGYVGNRAAVFPLQRMGHDVWAINTVQFSNHTGYGAWTGEVFSADHIRSVVDGIEARGVLPSCDAVLSGYIGSAEIGEAIRETVSRARAANPGLVYCCDPVMGDVGRGFFVRPGVAEFFRDHGIRIADIITPNQFELEFLSGRPIATLPDALDAADSVRSLGPSIVLVTSLTRSDGDPDRIEMLVDTAPAAWLVSTPRLAFDPSPDGGGDAVAALFLDKVLETGRADAALEHATSAIFALCSATLEARTRELALIQAQAELVEPKTRFEVQKVR